MLCPMPSHLQIDYHKALTMGRESVVEAAATRAQQTAEWLESHNFMPEEQLSNWAHVVRGLRTLFSLIVVGCRYTKFCISIHICLKLRRVRERGFACRLVIVLCHRHILASLHSRLVADRKELRLCDLHSTN